MTEDGMDALSSAEDFVKYNQQMRRRFAILLVILAAMVAAIYFLSMFLGSVDISPEDVIKAWKGEASWGDSYIIKDIRMPRAMCAAIVGAGLSVAGLAMQAMFRNPMASPSVLGISSGASFGACLAIGFGVGGVFGTFGVSFMAFVMCFITLAMVYALAYTKYGVPTVLLLLAGIAVGTFFSGMSSMIQYIVDDKDTLANIVYWTMGSFGKCTWASARVGLITVGLGVAIIAYFSRELNLISMGEDQAKSLGANIKTIRFAVLIGTALAVGGSVSISGIIGFVGLIIPHICRALMGPNHTFLWPICCLAGAIFLMTMDIISRTAFAPNVFPVGVLTSLIGAPFFIYIMRKKRNELWG